MLQHRNTKTNIAGVEVKIKKLLTSELERSDQLHALSTSLYPYKCG